MCLLAKCQTIATAAFNMKTRGSQDFLYYLEKVVFLSISRLEDLSPQCITYMFIYMYIGIFQK